MQYESKATDVAKDIGLIKKNPKNQELKML